VERFFLSQTHRVVDAIKAGGGESEVEFCRQWGGPLGLVAVVAEAWIEAERGAVTRRAKPSSSKGSGGKTRHNPEQWDEAPSSLPPIC